MNTALTIAGTALVCIALGFVGGVFFAAWLNTNGDAQ